MASRGRSSGHRFCVAQGLFLFLFFFLFSGAALAAGPLFIENVGQFDPQVKFQVWGGGQTIWITDDALWFAFAEAREGSPEPKMGPLGERLSPMEEEPPRISYVKVSFPGMNSGARIEPFGRLSTVVSYFIGNDPAKWKVGVPVWSGVRYVDIYPGVDLEILDDWGRWSWKWVEKVPGALARAKLKVEGAEEVEAGPWGVLRLSTPVGERYLPLPKGPVASRGEEPEIARLGALAHEVVHPVGEGSPPLFPVGNGVCSFLYSGFLGGSSSDVARAIVVENGVAYVAGETWSNDFPTESADWPRAGSLSSSIDAFVAAINEDGSRLVYAGFLGGSNGDDARAIAVENGVAYVAGETSSDDFPTANANWPGAGSYNDRSDGFVAAIKADGSGFVYSGFLGGSNGDDARAIAVENGVAYVAGETSSDDFPTANATWTGAGRYNSIGRYADAFVTAIKADGSGFLYSGYLGGIKADGANAIAVENRVAYVAGETWSNDFPTESAGWPGAENLRLREGLNAFVTAIKAGGSGFLYSGYLGGGYGDDRAHAIAVEDGIAYVVGETTSYDFPNTHATWPGAGSNNSHDAFVAAIKADGSGFLYSGFLGGSGNDYAYAIAVEDGVAYVAGYTSSNDFPTESATWPGAGSLNGSDDAFVTAINADGSGFLYSGFLGGSSGDEAWAIAVENEVAYVAGSTGSDNFPTANAGWPEAGSYHGSGDAFVTAIQYQPDTTPPGPVTNFTAIPGDRQVQLSWTNPSDPDFDHVVVVRNSDHQPTSSSDGTQIYSGSGTSYTDSGLTNGTTYYYAIYAYDQAGNESDPAFASATPQDTTPPGTVTGVSATPGDNQITLSWTNPTDADFDHVVIGRRTDRYPDNPTDGTQVYSGTGTSFTDTGLTDGTTYYYAIFSVDDDGNWSRYEVPTTNTTPVDNVPPDPVTGVSASPGDNQVSFSWTNPTTHDFDHVVIVRRTDRYPTNPTDGNRVYSGTGTSFTDTGLTDGTTYYYAVFSVDDSGNYTAYEVPIANTTPVDNTPPDSVTGVAATPGDNQVTLSWTNPTTHDLTRVIVVRNTARYPQDPSDGDEVYRDDNPGLGEAESYTDTGLTNGTAYYYTIFTVDDSGNVTRYNVPTTGTTPVDNVPPDPVADLEATPGDREATLTWTNPLTPDLALVRVVRKVGVWPTGPDDGTVVYEDPDPVPGGKEKFTDTGLQNNITYGYAVFARDDDGNWDVQLGQNAPGVLVTPQLVVPEGFVGVTPQPVGPDGGIFWFILPEDTTEAFLKVFDVDRALLVNVALDPGARRYPDSGRWIPEDDYGRLLGSGLYLWVIEIHHSDGSVTYTEPEKLVIVR